MPDDGGETGGSGRGRIRSEALGEPDARRSLGHVEEGYKHASRHARRAHDVGGAKVAAADEAQIRDVPSTRHQQRERDRPDEVGGEEDKSHQQ